VRAAVYQGVGLPHVIEDVLDPSPGDREVIIRIDRSGVCGSDVTFTSPRSAGVESFADAFYELYCPGAILGHEYAGEVIALGSGVARLRIGDRVAPMFFVGCGECLRCFEGTPHWCRRRRARMGGYAEYGLVHEQFCARVPAALSPGEGALIEPTATALHAWEAADARAGARVLVWGSGALGTGVVAVARMFGAGRIVAVARTEQRRELVLSCGADEFLTVDEASPEAVWAALGGKPDVVVEAAGVSGTIADAIAASRPHGTIVVAGLSASPELTWHAAAVMKELRIIYVNGYSTHDSDVAARLIERHPRSFDMMISRTVSLADFPARFEDLRSESRGGKLHLDPWGDDH
jgi:2-desacetyl-2-hydroxyethyl bacteriochlorophyllide A dehydrogenase